jgi:hypothetical protein
LLSLFIFKAKFSFNIKCKLSLSHMHTGCYGVRTKKLFRVTKRSRWTSLIWNFKVRHWLWLENIWVPLAHLTWGKLYCVVWIWFKGIDEFLTSGLSMARNENLCSWINLTFWIYYVLVCRNKFLSEDNI